MVGFLRAHRAGLLTAFAAVLFLVIFAAQYHDLPGDSDVWWHLEYGEEIVRDLDWNQHHDRWSWTPADPDWRYVTWIADVGLYGAYSLFGAWGITLLQSALFLGVAGLYLQLAWRRRGRFDAVDVLWLAAVFVAMRAAAAQPKAEMFSVFFFGAMVWTYVDARISSRDRFWWLPIIAWLWVNAHGAGLVACLLLGSIVVGETVARRTGGGLDARSYRRLLVFTGLAVLAMAINPEGPALVVDGFVTMFGFVGGEAALRIDEYATRWSKLVPGGIDDLSKALAGWATIALALAQGLLTIRRWRTDRSIDPVLVIGGAGFFFMAMQMARAGVYYPIFALIAGAALLRSDATAKLPRPRVEFVSVSALVVLAVAAVGLHVTVRTAGSWGWQSLERVQPVLESRFVRENDLPGPLFNDYVTGGYLVWDLVPAYRVFIDPRYGPYSSGLLERYDDIARAPGVEKVDRATQHFGFRTAVIGHRSLAALTQAFDRSELWTLVFVGPTAAVFVRDDLVSETVRAAIPTNTDPRRLAHYGDPLVMVSAANVTLYRDPTLMVDLIDLVGREITSIPHRRKRVLAELDGLLVELGWHVADGRRLSADEMLGRFGHLYQTGDLDSARFVAAAYLVEHPDDARMWFNRACVESLAGKVGAAADALDRALALGYDNLEGVATDTDLENLRAAPAFAKVVARHELDLAFVGR